MKFDRKRWVPWTGDFALLRNYLATKSRPPWIPLKVLDAVLRGYGQIAFANNSISGLLIVSALAATSPGIFSASLGTALLGLVFSVVSGESADKIQNGLTVFNPVLIGAVTYAVMPEVSDGSEILRLLLTISCTLFSVYLVRSIGNDRIPPLTLPFNLTELMLLFTLRISEGLSGVAPATDDWARENATGGVTLDAANGTGDALDWGMVFRGVITSSSQLYAVDSVPAAAVVYLAILVFSPTGCAFAFLGALLANLIVCPIYPLVWNEGSFLFKMGCAFAFLGALLANLIVWNEGSFLFKMGCAFAFLGALLANLIGLGLGVPREIIYSGVRGFNGLLTGAGLGGFFFVLRVQTAMATVIGIVFSTILEHIMIHVLGKVGLPAMSMPFVFTIWLFIGLRDSSSEVFPQPRNLSFHEKHRHEYLVYRRALKVNTVDTGSAVDISEGKAREEELDEIVRDPSSNDFA